jgi:ribosomal protein S28E/S33
MTLRQIAHARTGDKGDICNISLVVFDPRDYARIVERVTVQRVRAHFAGIVQGDITRFELPHLGAVNFVMTRALRGGVTRSLALDAHGKSLSSLLLSLEI